MLAGLGREDTSWLQQEVGVDKAEWRVKETTSLI